ncbi:type I-E CRISPR-associated protein Cas5/CasD [Acetobacter peroxydans]|jgi:CRISPR system Cascade subunit CasD|uniref:type I-E CRISPR-associated protein Cas5/CasD n=1 Tax=Acetobacter peroxydans TaxID=104098 RepID=UPI0023566781|nr:type I-E CRISPR-associated protein Cas5/CasD [Acetobacter peroxydans]MCH4143137.1 type I-E CRISPR-associated protein Cas5/CasD [Acetobacter peroxydans]MCI1393990.1 type I-E CRISPR-associated protein Cas5/CasD [Acetobacter peroxydans]MCI1411604.1 type I-E CRISPR-associated protein Cas5/CasD [Acetobacter peroxydans]MCI1440146.1 type I-E CRISPR-associated protein Cas5/CasD [Acetobacter peroxydans]MCI1566922.1 type I-E CRISPR-associated protein Cas5/CasD [Acetobacter peroxydans]
MMQPFLVFGLTASLGAMGELAGHERRGSLIWPARSAIIGLMGAALGIERDGDFSALDALTIDVAIFDAGEPLRDYHTIETVPSAAVKNPNSRPEALRAARGNTNTAITLRDYRTSVLYGIAVRGEGLERIAAALLAPHFTLYLGRKSCPLAAPTGARVVEAASAEAALEHLKAPLWRRSPVRAQMLVCDDPTGEVVSDVPLDRSRWHFSSRRVALRPVSIIAGG